MPRYIEVVSATTETATKVLALRAGTANRKVDVTTNGGATASVNWTDDLSSVVLNMPTLPPDAVLTRAEADRLVAFIGHECCHVLHSDRAAWNRAVAAGARVRDWTNALEDVRIEHAEIKAGHFPALGGLLASMANHLHYEATVGAAKVGHVIGSQIADAPYVACILGRLANSYPIPAAMGLTAGMSPQVSQLLDVALAGIRKCKSTDDVLILAQQLVDAEQTMPPPQDSENGQDGDPQDGQDGDPQDGQDGDPQDGQDGDPQDGQDGDPQDGQDGDPQDGQDKPEGDGAKIDNAPPSTETDLTEMVEKLAKASGFDGTCGYDRSPELSVVKSEVTTAPKQAAGTNQFAAQQLGQRLPKNSVLHGQIGRLLVSAEIHRVTHHESSGRLDRRALVRMQVGAPDVYSRRDDTPGIDTALLILVDGSSSMRGYLYGVTPSIQRMEVAQTTAWHVARAAESANAKVAIATFHTRREQGNPVSGATITLVKPWHVPVIDSATTLNATYGQGGTPLAPAILEASKMLAEINATRRILMVLTDGECDLGPMAVTRACTIAADRGIEAVGIGMSCASITAAFPPRYSINVTDMTQLAQKGLGALVAMLEDANPRGAD